VSPQSRRRSDPGAPIGVQVQILSSFKSLQRNASFGLLTYTQAFPSNPTKLNGYFLDFTFNSDTDTISFPGNPAIPGSILGGSFSSQAIGES
jgi:hypothetical protein